VYEGRLTSDPHAASRRLVLHAGSHPALKLSGLTFVAAEHEGCRQKSDEEACRVKEIYASLLQQHRTDETGRRHRMTPEDILVVSPYNMQVNLLQAVLPAGARVGTVDKFQGQEAAVVVVSMATSSAEDMPRNLEFLFSLNRINVAISRAQSLAVLIANPRLLEATCASVEQMRLVNTLCFAKAYAAPGALPPMRVAAH